jgi:DNA polymerase V
VYALVDVNNMYVSCERVSRPALVGRPVVVLSNNDGACIASSNEAKDLGIEMAQPWFQVRHLERTAGLIALSANFELYGDMSNRMMTLAAEFAPRQEIYSIDECFLDYDGVRDDLVATGRQLRSKVLRWTGLPTSVGLGPTKTLAKLANHAAKTADRKPGSYPKELAQVCNFGQLTARELDAVMRRTPVGEVWGVGRKTTARLKDGGIHTVLDLVRADAASLRREFSVVLEKTIVELRGTRCLDVDDSPSPNQQIMCSRSFGEPVVELSALREVVSQFASRVAEKLRQQQSEAASIHVFITTSPFRRRDRQHSGSVTLPLVQPTCDTRQIVQAAVEALESAYRPGFNYLKAGVMLVDLRPAGQTLGELGLFDSPVEIEREQRTSGRLMSALDTLNRRFGKGAIGLASAAEPIASRGYEPKRESMSPRYTSRLEEIPVVV